MSTTSNVKVLMYDYKEYEKLRKYHLKKDSCPATELKGMEYCDLITQNSGYGKNSTSNKNQKSKLSEIRNKIYD